MLSCARTFPSKGILFASNDFYQQRLCFEGNLASGLSGALAGFTAISLTYPLDLLRTRFASCVASQKISQRFVFNIACEILMCEGVKGLYKGIMPSLIGSIPMEGIKFLVYDYSYTWLKESNFSHHLIARSLSGAMAGFVAGVIMYPNDTLRKNMQLKDGKSCIKNVAKQLYSEGGVRRYYKGIIPYALRVVPSSAMQFLTYHSLKAHYFKK